MARINLLRDRGQETKFDTELLDIQGFSGGGGEGGLHSLFKLLFIFGFPLALYVYQWGHLKSLNSQISHLNVELQKVQRELTAEQEKVAKMKAHKKRLADVNKKIEAIKKLSSERLKAIKSLDFIQSQMPEKAWLTRLNYEPEKISLDGYAVSEDVFSKLLKGLEQNPIFLSVVPEKIEEVVHEKLRVKRFQIEVLLQKDVLKKQGR
ncbi:MAG: hypothetical protein D6797_01140 [Bdellovibrio sp.]|nr:MAG: hypothetical protein D6797_01140 [Bdellovibrio sp.]